MSKHAKVSSPQNTNKVPQSNQSNNVPVTQGNHLSTIIQKAHVYPQFLTHTDVMQLQRTIGNRAVMQLFRDIGLVKPAQKNGSAQEKVVPPETDKKVLPETVQKKENNDKAKKNDSAGVMHRSMLSRQSLTLADDVQLQLLVENHTGGQLLNRTQEQAVQKKENRTGLPDNLKAGVESLSGMDMSDVQVHYNSDKPAQVGALAYTQGTDIHVAPGQERHLPHEAWHVVQQAQERVKPTMQMKWDVPVNDDVRLETEADVMGAKAAQMTQEQNLKFETSIAAQRKLTGLNNTSGTYPAQLRNLHIEKKKLANLSNALKNKEFSSTIAKYYKDYGEDTVKYFAGQLFSSEGEDISSLEQYIIELQYDLETKSRSKDKLTLQERYMTTYGWDRAANNPSKAELGGKSRKLKLYRTMSIEDWKKLQSDDYSVLSGGHIGDFKQALKYFIGKSKDSKVMVEFTLKAGAEKTLFSNKLALPKSSERSKKLDTMAKAIGDKETGFPVCTTDQGMSKAAIGIKSEEEGEAGFSIGIGGGSTPELFHALVESVVLKSVGERYSNENNTTGISSRVEADANLLLGVNNCLINAISYAALGRGATKEELITIRGSLNNYGEMLLASPQVVNLIRTTLHITNTITVAYTNDYSEDFDGEEEAKTIYHVNGNHFTHEPP